MIFPRDLYLDLRPQLEMDALPFDPLLEAWIAARFEPGACRDVLERWLEAHPRWRPCFQPDAVVQGGVVASPRLLWPEPGPWRLTCQKRSPQGLPLALAALELGDEALSVVAEVLRFGSQGDDWEAFREECGFLGPEMLGLMAPGPQAAPPVWPAPDAPGLYRREHASLLIRSATTSLLVDPIGMATAFPHIAQAPLGSERDEVAAIAITHGHGDHWHLPSLFANASGAEVPLLVPHVPRPSLLSPIAFGPALERLGQTGRAVRWGEHVQVGDIRVEALPFYGEQPTRLAPGPDADQRNWGNCYRITTPEFSAVLLVDSGQDPEGDMVDVLRDSVRRDGPVDVVLSCMRRFDSPFFGGLSHYWATLPFERLRELFQQYTRGQLPSTTAGLEGIAALCDAARARYFLPSANGFEGVGVPIRDIGWGAGEPAEAPLLARLEEHLRERAVPTRVLSWLSGERLVFSGREARVTA